MKTMTERLFSDIWGAGTFPTFVLLLSAVFLLGCGSAEEERPRTIHFVEVANPDEVVARYDEDGLDDLFDELVRSGETTFVLVANHADGYVKRFPADIWFWGRGDRLDELEEQIRKAAAARDVTDQYQSELRRLSREVYGETKRPVLIRNTVFGGWSSLKEYADGKGPETKKASEVDVPEPDLGTPSSWSTILGSWLWTYGLVAIIFFLGWGWHQLGKKVQRRES